MNTLFYQYFIAINCINNNYKYIQRLQNIDFIIEKASFLTNSLLNKMIILE